MARIGRQIPHFNEIELDSISANFSPDMLYRYTLNMDYRPSLLRADQSERVTVILKNPSSANEKKADATIRKVETYVYKHFPKVKTLSILNMFAIRATDVKEVNLILKDHSINYLIGPENNNEIKNLMKNSDHIICAWGNNNGIHQKTYYQRIDEITNILKDINCKPLMVQCPKPTRQPLHGLMWGFDYQLADYQL